MQGVSELLLYFRCLCGLFLAWNTLWKKFQFLAVTKLMGWYLTHFLPSFANGLFPIPLAKHRESKWGTICIPSNHNYPTLSTPHAIQHNTLQHHKHHPLLAPFTRSITHYQLHTVPFSVPYHSLPIAHFPMVTPDPITLLTFFEPIMAKRDLVFLHKFASFIQYSH